MLVSTRSHARLDTFPCLFRLVSMLVSTCFHAGNKVFPWEKQSVPMLGTPPKVPSEQLEGAIPFPRKEYPNELYVLQGSIKNSNW